MNTTNEVNAPQEIKTSQEGVQVDLNGVEAPDYARQVDPEGLEALGLDMEQNTQLQNVVLIPKADGGYECVIGNRRVAAAKKRGWKTIRADIKEGLTETQKLLMTLAENEEREEASPFYTASLYKRIMAAQSIEPVKLAEELNKTLGHVSQMLSLAELPQEVRDNFTQVKLDFTHMRELMRLNDPKQQIQLAQECAEKDYSVRELQARVKQLLNPNDAPAKPAADPRPIRFSWKDGKVLIKAVYDPREKDIGEFTCDVDHAYRQFVDLHPMPQQGVGMKQAA